MSGSILAVTYDTTASKYLIQKLGSAQIADLAITSALIATDAVGTPHILDKNVTSAKLTSAIVSLLGSVADGAITSAKIASGQVGDGHIYPGSILSAKIAANIIATPHILNQGILSASLGAAIIAAPHIANQGLLSANFGAGAIGGTHVANQGLVSANLAVGVIGHSLVTDYGIVSGKVASGAITENELASGLSIDIAEMAQEPTFRAQTLISGSTPMGIQFSVSGYFSYAQARDISSMPAIGVTTANILSGQVGTFRYGGRLTNTGWDFSGYVGRLLYMGLSSEVTLTAPSVSGDCIQRVGKVVDSDTMFLNPSLQFLQIAG